MRKMDINNPHNRLSRCTSLFSLLSRFSPLLLLERFKMCESVCVCVTPKHINKQEVMGGQ
jgi:hypothetical protein